MYEFFIFSLQTNLVLRLILLFSLGAVIGSFLNVVIYRLPIILAQRQQNKKLASALKKGALKLVRPKFNLAYPPSHCTACKTLIPFWYNIPILAYLILGGRCHKCNSRISIRYPLLEFICGLLFLAIAYKYTEIARILPYLIFISFILSLILLDFDQRLIPNQLTLPLLGLAIAVNWHGFIAGSLANSLLGALIGYLSFYLMRWLNKLSLNRVALADANYYKLLAAILAFLGYQYLTQILILSLLVGLLYRLMAKRWGKADHLAQLPYGSILGLASLISLI